MRCLTYHKSKKESHVPTTLEQDIEKAPKEIREAKADYDKCRQAISQLDKHVKKGASGKFELKAKDAKEAGVDADVFETLKVSLELGNEHGERGIVSAEEMPESASGSDSGRERARADDFHENHWWGTRTYVNEASTHELVLEAQKSATAIAAVLRRFGVPAIVAAAIAGALFLMVAALWMICAWGGHKGLVIDRTWSGWTTVWHQ